MKADTDKNVVLVHVLGRHNTIAYTVIKEPNYMCL